MDTTLVPITSQFFDLHQGLKNKRFPIRESKVIWLNIVQHNSEPVVTKSMLDMIFNLVLGCSIQITDADAIDPTRYTAVINETLQNLQCKRTKQEDNLFNQGNWFIQKVEGFFMEIIGDPQLCDTLFLPWLNHLERFLYFLSANEDKTCNIVGSFTRLVVLSSLCHTRKHMVDNDGGKLVKVRYLLQQFEQGMEFGFKYTDTARSFARKFCELVQAYPDYYVIESSIFRNHTLLLQLTDFNVTIMSLRCLQQLVQSAEDEISLTTQNFVIEFAGNFFKLLLNKDPSVIVECMNLYNIVQAKHSFPKGQHLFSNIEESCRTMWNIGVNGTKSVRRLVKNYLTQFLTPQEYALHIMVFLSRIADFNYCELDQMIEDMWHIDALCDWRHYNLLLELKGPSVSIVVIVMLIRSALKKLVADINYKQDNAKEIQALSNFYESIDETYHSLNHDKKCQINFIRSLDLINLHKIQGIGNEMQEIITGCYTYLFETIVCDYDEYEKRKPLLNQQLEESYIIIKLCFEWREICNGFNLPVLVEKLIIKCKTRFCVATNCFQLANYESFPYVENFDFYIISFANLMKVSQLSMLTPSDISFFFATCIPYWLNENFYRQVTCKIALVSAATNIIHEIWRRDAINEVPSSQAAIIECIDILRSKLCNLCRDFTSSNVTSSLYGKCELFSTFITAFKVHAEICSLQSNEFDIDSTKVYLEALGNLLEVISCQYKDERCLAEWVKLLQEFKSIPPNASSYYVLQHFGMPSSTENLMRELVKVLYSRQQNHSIENALTLVMVRIIRKKVDNEEMLRNIMIKFVQVIKYEIQMPMELRAKLFFDITKHSIEEEIVYRKVVTGNRIKTILISTEPLLKEICNDKICNEEMVHYLDLIMKDLSNIEKEQAERVLHMLLLKFSL